jgi:hypothetical protein
MSSLCERYRNKGAVLHKLFKQGTCAGKNAQDKASRARDMKPYINTAIEQDDGLTTYCTFFTSKKLTQKKLRKTRRKGANEAKPYINTASRVRPPTTQYCGVYSSKEKRHSMTDMLCRFSAQRDQIFSLTFAALPTLSRR